MNKQTGNIRGPGPGRPAGSPNKITGDMRAMILQAFEKAGGADWLARQADENPVAFMGLLGKLLPAKVDMDANVINHEMPAVIRRVIIDPAHGGAEQELPSPRDDA